MRTMISDELWDTLGPVVEQTKPHRCGHPPVLSDRDFLEALLYWARTGIPWRDRPSDFGDGSGVYNRFRRWAASGHLQAIFAPVTDNPVFGPIRRIRIDSTIIRAHPHAAGARRKVQKIGKERSATAQGLGRSRGGFSTTVVVTASDENTAVVVEVIPGQASDARRFEPMRDRTWDRVPVIDEVDADKGFDGDQQRHACTARGVFANIPNKKNWVRPWSTPSGTASGTGSNG